MGPNFNAKRPRPHSGGASERGVARGVARGWGLGSAGEGSVGEGIRVACFVLPIHLRPRRIIYCALSTESLFGLLCVCVCAAYRTSNGAALATRQARQKTDTALTGLDIVGLGLKKKPIVLLFYPCRVSFTPCSRIHQESAPAQPKTQLGSQQ